MNASKYTFLRRRGSEKPVRPCGSPTCTPKGKQATLLALPQGSNWRGAERKKDILPVTLKG